MQDNFYDEDNQGVDEELAESKAEGELPGTPQQKKIGDQALLDLTDRKNDEFIYIY